jgi:hypothetical protein
MTGATMGFASELEHFREVLAEGATCRSDMASAAATLDLTDTIATLATA